MKGDEFNGRNWTTSNEMFYVQELATGECFKGCPYIPILTREQRLKNYKKSALKRIAWGTYVPDGETVLAYVDLLLKE